MKTSVHLIVSLIIAAVLYPFFSWASVFILVGGVLIDIDHYFWYVYKEKKFGLRECYKYFTSEAEKKQWKYVLGILLVFHTIEFLAFAVILSFYSKIVFAFTVGLLSHYILDALFLLTVSKRVIANHSIISWAVKKIK